MFVPKEASKGTGGGRSKQRGLIEITSVGQEMQQQYDYTNARAVGAVADNKLREHIAKNAVPRSHSCSEY